MVDPLVAALGRLKASLSELLDRETIHHCCREVGHHWRQRVLDPATTLHVFILQILHRNTACEHLPHLSDLGFTSAAYCQARSRLPLEAIRLLLSRLALPEQTDDRWRGHRTFLADGSSFSMPDTPALQSHFGQPTGQKKGCGFPVAHLMAMFHAGTGLLIDAFCSPWNTHDHSQVGPLHHKLEANDLLVLDRGFCSFGHLAQLKQRSLHGLIRLHQAVKVDFTPHRSHAPRGGNNPQGRPTSRWIRSLGLTDQIVEWFKPLTPPRTMTPEHFDALPSSIEVRELRYRVDRSGFRTKEVTLVTTLLDPEAYPADALIELYGTRWRVEGELRNLKQTMGMDTLRCRSVEGIQKELAVFALVYNLIRIVMLAAARRQGVPLERISFIDAVRWLCSARPGKRLGKLVTRPDRSGRAEPRVRKRRPKNYRLMTKPRQILKQELYPAA